MPLFISAAASRDWRQSNINSRIVQSSCHHELLDIKYAQCAGFAFIVQINKAAKHEAAVLTNRYLLIY